MTSVEIVRALIQLLKRFPRDSKKPDSQVELYDDRFWPWFRCFIWIWVSLIASGGAALFLDAIVPSAVCGSYAYGISRFWFFYTPVFGFFMQAFYREYASDGVWTPGLSYKVYSRDYLRDFFGRWL